MIIRKHQFIALSAEIHERENCEMARRIRLEHPAHVIHMSDDQLITFIRTGRDEARELMIVEADTVYRYIRLNFLLNELLQSPLLQSVVIRVLNNIDLDGAKRLDFVEQHVMHRQEQ